MSIRRIGKDQGLLSKRTNLATAAWLALCLGLWMAPASRAADAEAPAASVGAPKKANLILNNAPIDMVISSLEQQTGDRVVVKGKAAGEKVTIAVKEKTTLEVLEILANQKGWVWWQRTEDGVYEIMDPDTYKTSVLAGQTIQRVFKPRYRTADEIRQQIEGVLTPNIGTIATDPTTNQVFVTDLPDRIAVMQRLIDTIDIPLYTHIFQIRNAKVADIESQISSLLSEVGTIQVDERTHQIIVRDLFENIKQMELLVMALDKLTEVRVYDVNRIGMEGEDFEQLMEAIADVVTDESSLKANAEQGKIYVEDVPEVHDRIARLLKVFDSPPKQIYLQAEILETSLNRALNFSAEFRMAEDLESALRNKISTLPFLGTVSGNDADDFDFAYLKEAFPTFNIGGGGFSMSMLGSHYAMMLSALLTDEDTRILLRPQMIVKNQQEAFIRVGVREPIATTFQNYNNVGGTGLNSVTQQSVDTGLEVNFRPSITSSGLVELEISMSNSQGEKVTLNVPSGGSTAQYDAVRTRDQEADTVMIIPSGETRVIGGLIRREETETKKGVPGLRNLPLIGPIFGSYERKTSDRTLLFFVTPTIIEERGRDDILEASQAAYAELVGGRRKQLDSGQEQSPWAEGPPVDSSPFELFTSGTQEQAEYAEGMAAETLIKAFAGRSENEAAPGFLEESQLPDVFLSDEPPPNLFEGTSEARAFEGKTIVRPATNYTDFARGPSGRVQPVDRQPIVRPETAAGSAAAAPTGAATAGAPSMPAPGASAIAPTGVAAGAPAAGGARTPTPTPAGATPTPAVAVPTPDMGGAAAPIPTPVSTPLVTPPLPTPPPLPPPPMLTPHVPTQ